ncbi:MAG: hypothetical protein ACK5PS_12080 [Desulfopila sp.]
MDDITDILAYEVKKEMADRYFGFRKQIESDTAAYLERLALSSLKLENEIGFTLIRLYILLHSAELIARFIRLTGLPEYLYYDPYLLESPTIKKRVFTGASCRGLTRQGRFVNMVLDTYARLEQQVTEYRATQSELTEEQETIRAEINLFYRRNDIDTILRFIRRLDNPGDGTLHAIPPEQGVSPFSLAEQMQLQPPRPACELLPVLPAIPDRQQIGAELKELARIAFRQGIDLDLPALTRTG